MKKNLVKKLVKKEFILFLLVGAFIIYINIDLFVYASNRAFDKKNLCEIPGPNKIFTSNAELCKGVYRWPFDILGGITIKGDEITLNCNGAKLIGAGITHGIDILGNNNTVKNCYMENWFHAIHSEGSGNLIMDNTVVDYKEYGIHLKNGYAIIRDNTILNKNQNKDQNLSLAAIGLYPTSQGSEISNNNIDSSAYFGIYDHGIQDSRTLLLNNTISNSVHGIFLSEGSNLVTAKNNYINNVKIGINLGKFSENNFVKENRISNSKNGVFIQRGALKNSIEGNIIEATDNLIIAI